MYAVDNQPISGVVHILFTFFIVQDRLENELDPMYT